ncbi:hypothetical protein [Streptomyces paradoxus]|uniref:hypothetical protein n=1 Tax=Streptomyces paradoxus TaxID=66375 RepID=UPI003822153B
MCHTREMRLAQRVSAQQLGGLVPRVLGSGLSVCHDVSSLAHQVLEPRLADVSAASRRLVSW